MIVTAGFLLLGVAAFCQQETNGTIYIKHPYIDVVDKIVKAYMDQDDATNKMHYSDTAKYWVSGLDNLVPMGDAYAMWKKDFEYFDDVKLTGFGYPDYLHYKKDDTQVVQSWWIWSGKSKKTGEVIKVYMVMFDDFNKDGKIVRESVFGDFSKVIAEQM